TEFRIVGDDRGVHRPAIGNVETGDIVAYRMGGANFDRGDLGKAAQQQRLFDDLDQTLVRFACDDAPGRSNAFSHYDRVVAEIRPYIDGHHAGAQRPHHRNGDPGFPKAVHHEMGRVDVITRVDIHQRRSEHATQTQIVADILRACSLVANALE